MIQSLFLSPVSQVAYVEKGLAGDAVDRENKFLIPYLCLLIGSVNWERMKAIEVLEWRGGISLFTCSSVQLYQDSS